MSDFARLQELARQAGLAVTPPSVVDVPYVSPETAAVGSTLNCTMGNWTYEPDEYSYQWMRDGTPVSAAEVAARAAAERSARAGEVGTAANYTVVADDAGHSLSCVVTATNEAGSTIATPSNAIAIPAAARRTEHRTEQHPAHRDVPTPVHDAHADARRDAAAREVAAREAAADKRK